MSPVNARRPLVYLAVAAVLSLAATLLSGLTFGGAPPSAPQAPPAPPAAAACSGTQESLRPSGPLPAPGQMPAGSTMAAIAARGRLIAGVDQGKYLLGFRDPSTGTLQGSDIDVVRQVAAAIFGSPDRVQFVVLNISDRAQAVFDGRVDLVVNSFTVTCDRQRQVEFSTAYMAASQRMLVPASSGVTEVEQLAGKKVCTSTGSTTEKVLRALPIGLQVQTLAGIPDCVVELQRGQVDAVSSDDVILAGLAAQDPQTRVVGRPLDHALYAVGMSLKSPDLVRFVNGVLEKARADGSLAASNQRWLGRQLDPVPQPAPARYRD